MSGKSPTISAPRDTANRIIAAAYRCFEQYGIRKTTIEDIANEASLSRPTVYKHFPSKDDIVDAIKDLESAKVNAVIRRTISHEHNSFEDILTECLLVTSKMTKDNIYIREIISSPGSISRSIDVSTTAHWRSRRWWGSLLDRAAANGDLASHLSVDDATSWLVLANVVLRLKTESGLINEPELRQFIRDFIISPLINERDGSD